MSGNVWMEHQSEEERQNDIDILKSLRRMRMKWIAAICGIGAGITTVIILSICCFYPISYEKAKVQVSIIEPVLDENDSPVPDEDGTPLSEITKVYYLDRGINRIKKGADEAEVLELIEKYGHLLWERGTLQQ